MIPDNKVDVPIAVIVTPSHAPGVGGSSRLPCQREAAALLIAINLIMLPRSIQNCGIPNRKIEFTIPVVVNPGHRIGFFCEANSVIGEGKTAIFLIMVNLVGLVIVADSQVEPAVVVIISPGHASGEFCVINGFKGHKMACAIIAINLVGLVIIANSKVQVAVPVRITPSHAICTS